MNNETNKLIDEILHKSFNQAFRHGEEQSDWDEHMTEYPSVAEVRQRILEVINNEPEGFCEYCDKPYYQHEPKCGWREFTFCSAECADAYKERL